MENKGTCLRAATHLDQVLERPAKSPSQLHRLFELLKEESIYDIKDCAGVLQRLPDRSRGRGQGPSLDLRRESVCRSEGDNPTTIEFKHLTRQSVDYHLYGERMRCYDDSWEAPGRMSGEELETGCGIRIGGRDTITLDGHGSRIL